MQLFNVNTLSQVIRHTLEESLHGKKKCQKGEPVFYKDLPQQISSLWVACVANSFVDSPSQIYASMGRRERSSLLPSTLPPMGGRGGGQGSLNFPFLYHALPVPIPFCSVFCLYVFFLLQNIAQCCEIFPASTPWISHPSHHSQVPTPCSCLSSFSFPSRNLALHFNKANSFVG